MTSAGDDDVTVSLRGSRGGDDVTLKRRSAAAEVTVTEPRAGAAVVVRGAQRIVIPSSGLTLGDAPTDDVQLGGGPGGGARSGWIVRRGDETFEYVDAGAEATVNGERVGSRGRRLTTGDMIEIAGERLRFEAGSAPARLPSPVEQMATLVVSDRIDVDSTASGERRVTHAGLRLQAVGVAVDVSDRTILQPMWLTIEPGELVAVVGESGAGKTTLTRCLAGATLPSSGQVLVNGEDVVLRQLDIGYVPQDDIVHGQLTVREALGYAAALRLPPDTTKEDRASVVERVIVEVELEHHADTLVSSLSGGQRKRVNVASELVDRPGLLFLDEPTTGLDPALERRMMGLLRDLADHDRTVLLVTHATRSLTLCDRLVVLARGGFLAFSGSPADALAFFGVDHPDDVCEALERRRPEEWQTTFLRSRYNTDDWSQSAVPPGAPQRVTPKRSAWKQVAPLTSRHVKVFLRDRRNLMIIALQAVLLGLVTAMLFVPGVFNRMPAGQLSQKGFMHVGEGAQLLFLLVTVAIWFGAVASAREIVKERSVLDREIAVGVRVRAYLVSKLVPSRSPRGRRGGAGRAGVLRRQTRRGPRGMV